MYPTLSKKQFVYWLLLAILVQIVGITKATAQGATTPFKTTWKVANSNIIIPTNSASGTYNYTVNYRKKGTTTYTTLNSQTGNCTLSGLTNGDTIQVEITGTFPHFYMNDNATEKTKLLSIDAWGNQIWKSMGSAFWGCSNLTYSATDNPDLTSVTNMSGMFLNCSNFNGNIGGWNTSKVTDMRYVFAGATIFNQNISTWNTGNVLSMYQMFQGATKFNQNIGGWDVSKVTTMSAMFSSASEFNQDLSQWNTSNVTYMGSMFSRAFNFNQPLTNWNTAKVTEMAGMFNFALAFNQDLSVLEINAVTDMIIMLNSCGLSAANYDATLTGWLSQNKTGLTLGAAELTYCTAGAARTSLITPTASGGKGWTITGDKACSTTVLSSSQNPASSGSNVTFTATVSPNTATGTVTFKDGTTTLGTGTLSAGVATFAITTLSAGTRSITAVYEGSTTNASSTSAVLSQVITIDPLSLFITRWNLATAGSGTTSLSFSVGTSGTVSYTWQEVGGSGLSGSGTFTGSTAAITGLPTGAVIDLSINPTNFRAIIIGDGSDKNRLTEIKQWGTVAWTSMGSAFWGCSNLTYSATNNPNLTSVTNMNFMFAGCSKFNGNIGSWNTSNVTNMSGFFGDATIFNQDISSWNTANVTNMSQMFQGATKFNQNIGAWNVSKVTNMGSLFSSASEFNQDLSQWNTSNVTNMSAMFSRARKFNQPLTNWNTAKVTNMLGMFNFAATFNQDLSVLEINAVTNMTQMLDYCGLSAVNYDATLTGWLSQNKTGLTLGANGLKYCAAEAARTSLITSIANGGKGWTITGDGNCGPAAPTASAQTFCSGKTVANLVATGQNIKWYSALTGGTALANTTVLATATYYASQTVGGVESTRTAVSVTVNAPTLATVTLSPSTICAGTAGSIVPTITNGGSNYTYVWKINQVTQTVSSPTISYSNAGASDDYSLTVTPSAEVCPSIPSVTASLTIKPTPNKPIITGKNEICFGESTVLSTTIISSPSVATFLWSTMAITNSINVAPTSTQIYTVTTTLDACVSQISDGYAVTVNRLPNTPTITADNMSICKGGNSILTGTCSSTTDIFRWSTPVLKIVSGTTLPSSNTRVVTEPGTYKGLCESNKGCLSAEVNIVITQGQNCNGQNFIVVTPVKPVICSNSSVTLTATGCSGTMTWIGGPSPQTGNSVVVSPTVTTTYLVQCSTGGAVTVDVVVATTNVVVSNNITTGTERVKATEIIESNKKIGDPNFTPAPAVSYEAGKAIILKPGFVAEKWSTFKAEIKVCN